MSHSPTARPRSRLHAAARGLLALTVLAALVVGVPAALLALGTLPEHIPTLDEARQALLAQDDSGTSLMATMTLAAWAAWLWLTIPVLIEVVAVLARRTTPRLPGMMTGQRLAGYLIASVLLAAPAATASAATLTAGPITAAPHTPAATAAPSTQPGQASAPTKIAPQAPATGTFTVGEGGTTWWELAEQLLGDGARYQELRTLNPQAPTGQSLLPEGTTVTVPATVSEQVSAVPAAYTQPVAADAAPARAEKEKDVTVRAGDSLSGIAQQRLGDASRWPDLYAASKDRPQPHGLPQITDPDVIYPGQTVVLPHATPPKETSSDMDDKRHEPADKTPEDTTSEPSHSPTAPSENGREDSDTARPRPSTSASAGSSAPGGQTSRPAPTTTPSSQDPAASTVPAPAEPTSATNRTSELRTALGAFALLAAAVTGALGTRRLLQRRRRKVGETIAIADAPSPAAAQLAQLAEPLIAPRFNQALRTLAYACAETGQPLPELRVARLSQKSLSVLPVDEDSMPLAPFTGGQDGWWLLHDDAELLDEDQARDVPPPYPAFVTIGADETTGDLILLNMAADRVVLLDGSEDDLRQVCRSIVLELAMNEWSDPLEIITVGFGEDLIRLLPTMRFGYRRKAEHALRDLADWMLASVQLPGESGDAYLLVCASSLDPDTAWQLAEMLDKAGDLTVMVIAPAEHTARHFGDAQVLDAAATSPQHLDGTDVELIVQRIDEAAYQQITTDLQISGQPPHPAKGAWQAVPEEPAEPAPARQTTASVDGAGGPSAASFGPADLGVFPALLATAQGAVAEPAEPGRPASPALVEADASPAQHHSRKTTLVPQTAAGPQGPVLSVLGTVQVLGVSGSSCGPREAQLAALLHFKPGRSADTLCTDMDPLAPWTNRTLNTRMGDLRRALGDDPEGNPYVPRRAALDDPYVISPEVRCDWDEFRALAEQALVNGPADVALLEAALGMVRGRPFGTHLLPWAEPLAQEMVTRIIDVAHTVAQWRTEAGHGRDLVAARQAVSVGLEVDNSAELLYRDWFRIEHASGNRSGLHTAISRLQQINQSIDASPEPETQHLIQQLLNMELNS